MGLVINNEQTLDRMHYKSLESKQTSSFKPATIQPQHQKLSAENKAFLQSLGYNVRENPHFRKSNAVRRVNSERTVPYLPSASQFIW